jgi:S-adenosylmethionine:tRNA ribosyltransferase-isomerase
MSPGTLIRDFDYRLPGDRVAQQPCARREEARLMVLDRAAPGREITEATVAGLGIFLKVGDLLVLNDSRVIPARLRSRKRTGGRVDLLLLEREPGEPIWRCLASTGKGLRPGTRLLIAPGFEAEFLGEIPEGRVRVRLHADPDGVEGAIRRHGVMPLPPYIRREPGDPRDALDRERYQTVYAREEGSIAAPTAGLHFTETMLEDLARRGIGVAHLTLHVGPGTFQPVRTERVEDHHLQPEACRLPVAAAEAVAACRTRGGRVVAVGTTVTRVLEWCGRDGGPVRPGEGWCDLLITPAHRFRVVDALLTNFHLPRTSLLVLVAAFAGRERILAAYEEAVARGFRFYSYGDAMLIL